MSATTCDCEIYEICSICAPTPEHYESAVAAYTAPEAVPQPLSGIALVDDSRYTLAELTGLGREYADAARKCWAETDVVDTELQLSLFIAWLARKEKEAISDRSSK